MRLAILGTRGIPASPGVGVGRAIVIDSRHQHVRHHRIEVDEALYEIERTNQSSDKPLATVRLRWKLPRDVNRPAASVGGGGDTGARDVVGGAVGDGASGAAAAVGVSATVVGGAVVVGAGAGGGMLAATFDAAAELSPAAAATLVVRAAPWLTTRPRPTEVRATEKASTLAKTGALAGDLTKEALMVQAIGMLQGEAANLIDHGEVLSSDQLAEMFVHESSERGFFGRPLRGDLIEEALERGAKFLEREPFLVRHGGMIRKLRASGKPKSRPCSAALDPVRR